MTMLTPREMLGIGMYAGLRVIESSNAVQSVPAKWSWIDHVISWNPCNRELLPVGELRPCAYIVAGHQLLIHPSLMHLLASA